jgi:hypothetical protein
VAPPVFKTGLAAIAVTGGFDSLPPPPISANPEAKIKISRIIRRAWQLWIATVSCTLTRASRLLRKEPQHPRRLPSPATKRARG